MQQREDMQVRISSGSRKVRNEHFFGITGINKRPLAIKRLVQEGKVVHFQDLKNEVHHIRTQTPGISFLSFHLPQPASSTTHRLHPKVLKLK